MTIERLGPTGPISNYNKTGKVSKADTTLGKDSIDVSEEAKQKAEIFKALENLRSVPDVREDRIAEVKKKLEDPNYLNEKVIETVADRIMDLFKL
ncbi:MAG: flagellar biosynthesis anti-sigma factor FlgM [Spirochaetales bacterium]